MTIYFTASIVGKRHYLDNYLKIIEIFKSKNLKVISDHIINTTEAQIRLEKVQDRLKFHNQLEKWINSCDFVVAETSFPSISVGYEISLALHYGKPVLILYSEGNPPSLLAQHKDEKLVCKQYTLSSLSDLIADFINHVKGIDDTKFTFLITPEIASFLNRISIKGKVPKSVYLRQLIEEGMKSGIETDTSSN